MKLLKLVALLVLVLAVMRAGSWLLQWVLLRVARLPDRTGVVVGNTLALTMFGGLLWWDLAPGEPMDLEALLFGLAVFSLCAVADWFWTPLRPRR